MSAIPTTANGGKRLTRRKVSLAGTSRHSRSGGRSFLVASLARGQVEVLQFFRSRDAVVFTLALPVVLLGLLASIFSGKVQGTGVSFSQVYVTGLLAGGLASTSFLNLGITITGERENGTLKRLAGRPARDGAAPATWPEQRAGRFRRRTDPDVLPGLQVGRGSANPGALSKCLGRQSCPPQEEVSRWSRSWMRSTPT